MLDGLGEVAAIFEQDGDDGEDGGDALGHGLAGPILWGSGAGRKAGGVLCGGHVWDINGRLQGSQGLFSGRVQRWVDSGYSRHRPSTAGLGRERTLGRAGPESALVKVFLRRHPCQTRVRRWPASENRHQGGSSAEPR